MKCGKHHAWVKGKCKNCLRMRCDATTVKHGTRCTNAVVKNGHWAEHIRVKVDWTKCMVHQPKKLFESEGNRNGGTA